MIFVGKPELYFSTSKASVVFKGYEYEPRNKAEEELLIEEAKKGTVFLKPGEVTEPKKEEKKVKSKK